MADSIIGVGMGSRLKATTSFAEVAEIEAIFKAILGLDLAKSN